MNDDTIHNIDNLSKPLQQVLVMSSFSNHHLLHYTLTIPTCVFAFYTMLHAANVEPLSYVTQTHSIVSFVVSAIEHD